MKTRKQYLNNKCTHREYYAQFINNSTINSIRNYIGIEKIKNSDCEYFNDIPLKIWDNAPVYITRDLLNKLGESYTLSVKVCIAKEAAKQIKENN